MRAEAAADAADRAGDGKGGQPVAGGGNAQRGGQHLVLTQHGQPAPEDRRLRAGVIKQRDQRQHRQHQIVILPRVREVQAQKARRMRQAEHAAHAAGDRGPGAQDDDGKLAEGKGGDGEVKTAQPQADKAQEHADGRRKRRPDRQRQPEGQALRGGQKTGRIAADAAKAGLRQRQPPGADHDGQANGQHRVHHHQHQHVQLIGVRQEQGGGDQHGGQQAKPQPVKVQARFRAVLKGVLQGHTTRSLEPNSPSGLNASVRISSKSGIAGAMGLGR